MNNTLRETTLELFRYIPSALVPSMMGVVSVAVFTRLLSPEEYGLYIMVVTTAMFVSTFVFSWIHQSTLRYYARYSSNKLDHLLATSLFSFITMSVLMLFSWYLIQAFLPKMLGQRLWQLLLLGPLVVFAQSGFSLVQTLQRARRESMRYSFHASGNSVFRFVFAAGMIILLDMKAEALLLAIIISGLPVLVAEVLRLKRECSFSHHHFSQPLLKQLSHYGLPLIGIACSSMILSSSDRYVIEYFCGSSQVGIYSAGYKIAESSIILFVYFLMTVSFPSLIDSYEKAGINEAVKLMKYYLSIYVIILIPVVFGISFLRREITSVLFHKSFYDSNAVLPWVLSGVFFMGMSMFFNKGFELKEKTRALFLLIGSSAVLNIVLNLVFVPFWGIVGAAVSTSLAYLVGLIASILFGRRLINWEFPVVTLFKAMVSGTGMCAAMCLVPEIHSPSLALMVKISTGFFSYFAIISVLEKQTVVRGIRLLKRRMSPILDS